MHKLAYTSTCKAYIPIYIYKRGIVMVVERARRRVGAKPKFLKRIARTFRLTEDEYKVLKPLIEAIRLRTEKRQNLAHSSLDI